MAEHVLASLALILILGITSQWVAWALRLPAILILLGIGVMAGPFTELLVQHGYLAHRLLDPNELFGKILLPFVSMSVAVILFEGGLTLNFRDIAETASVVRNLVSIGALLSWGVIAVAAHFCLGMPGPLSILVGAILVVTGPTVIGPLLRHVRPVGQVGPVLRWEGIVIDPIGALLALLVFEALPLQGHIEGLTRLVFLGVLKTVAVGSVIGLVAALVLIFLFRRYWIPDYLHNAMTIMILIAAFTASNLLQTESGLFAVTVMGIALANQRAVSITHIAEFKENLSILLLSSLFIVIAARLTVQQLSQIGWRHLLFLGVLIVVARPVSVLLSTLGSGLTWKERAFLCWMAPRGVVAAAVSSVFALRLQDAGYEDAYRLVPTTFAVIVGTVAVYGTTAGRVAKWLGLAKPQSLGFLVAGANVPARAVAAALRDAGVEVLVVDTNRANIDAARRAGLPTYYGSISARQVLDRIDLTGIGRLLALTPNDAVNAIATMHFARHFGRSEVYQLSPASGEGSRREKVAAEFTGRYLFGRGLTFETLARRLAAGDTIAPVTLEREFRPDDSGNGIVPLFARSPEGTLSAITADATPTLGKGQQVIALVKHSTGSPA